MKEYQDYEIGDLDIKIGENKLGKNEYDIKELKMTMKENSHTKVELQISIKEEHKAKYDLNKFLKSEKKKYTGDISYNNQILELCFEEKRLFSGIVKKVFSKEEDLGGLIIELESLSTSELLDRVKHYRSYQNIGSTYLEIVEEVLKKYGMDITVLTSHKNLKKETKKLIIQYYETDWEFIVRIMSHIGLGVHIAEVGTIILGHVEGENRIIKWNEKLGDYSRGLDELYNVIYEVSTLSCLVCGNKLKAENRDMGFVSSGELKYEGGVFKGNYILKSEEHVYDYIANEEIKGSVIEGNVVEIIKNSNIAQMTVNFTKGLEKISGKRKKQNRDVLSEGDYLGSSGQYYVMPYTTPYSQSNTGFFCTPEIKDVVAIYFPTTEEEECYAQWSVNNPGNGRFSDPNVRNYTLGSNEEMTYNLSLNTDTLKMYTQNLTSYESKDKIVMNSQRDVKVISKETMSIISKNKMDINSTEYMSLSTDGMEVRARKSKKSLLGKKEEKSTENIVQVSGKYKIDSGDYKLTVKN